MSALILAAWTIYSNADRTAQIAIIAGLVGLALACRGLFETRRTIADAVRIDPELARADREARQFATFKQPTLTAPAPKAFSKAPIPINPNHRKDVY